MRAEFCIQFQLDITRLVWNDIANCVDIMISARPYRTATESAQAIVAAHKELFDVRDLHGIAIRNANADINAVGPGGSQSYFTVITCISFDLEILREWRIPDQGSVTVFYIGACNQSGNISGKVQYTIEVIGIVRLNVISKLVINVFITPAKNKLGIDGPLQRRVPELQRIVILCYVQRLNIIDGDGE